MLAPSRVLFLIVFIVVIIIARLGTFDLLLRRLCCLARRLFSRFIFIPLLFLLFLIFDFLLLSELAASPLEFILGVEVLAAYNKEYDHDGEQAQGRSDAQEPPEASAGHIRVHLCLQLDRHACRWVVVGSQVKSEVKGGLSCGRHC